MLQPKSPKPEPLPLSVPWLEALLKTTVLKGSQKPPNAAAMAILARRLGTSRDINRRQMTEWKPDAERRLSISRAAQVLMAELPTLRSDLEKDMKLEIIEAGNDVLSRIIVENTKQEIEAITAVLGGLQGLLDSLSFNSGQFDRLGSSFETWHQIATTIGDLFREAMRSTNPHKEIGNDGPVPKFVTAVIPHITDDSPCEGTVRNLLKREARENRNKVPG